MALLQFFVNTDLRLSEGKDIPANLFNRILRLSEGNEALANLLNCDLSPSFRGQQNSRISLIAM